MKQRIVEVPTELASEHGLTNVVAKFEIIPETSTKRYCHVDYNVCGYYEYHSPAYIEGKAIVSTDGMRSGDVVEIDDLPCDIREYLEYLYCDR